MSKFIVYFKQLIFIENLFLIFNNRPSCFNPGLLAERWKVMAYDIRRRPVPYEGFL